MAKTTKKTIKNKAETIAVQNKADFKATVVKVCKIGENYVVFFSYNEKTIQITSAKEYVVGTKVPVEVADNGSVKVL